MPNIVTPNKDGINDFIDFTQYNLSNLKLEIYSRWGDKIFQSDNPSCLEIPRKQTPIDRVKLTP